MSVRRLIVPVLASPTRPLKIGLAGIMTMESKSSTEGTLPDLQENAAQMLHDYQSVFQVAGCVLLTLDASLNMIAVSASIQALYGHVPERLIGRPYEYLIDPENRPSLQDFFDRLERGQPPHRIDLMIQLPSGQSRRVYQMISRLSEDSPGHYQIMLQDSPQVTARYQDLFEATFDAIAVQRGDVIIDINPAFEGLFGYTRQEAIGLIGMPYIPDMAQFMVRQYLQSNRDYPFETLGIRKDGDLIPIEIQSKMIQYQGESVYYVTVRDLSERKRNEREIRSRERLYRTLARNLPDAAVFLYDHGGQFLIAEGPALKTHLFPGEGMEGRNLKEALDQHPELEGQFRSALKGQESHREYTLNEHIFSVHALPVRAGDGEIFAGMTLMQDVTRERQSQKALAASERRMRALLDTLPDMMFVTDRDGTYTEVHASDTSLLIAPADKLIGLNMRDTNLPEDVVDEALAMIRLALDTGDTQSFEYSLEFDGHEQPYYFDVRLTALNENEALLLVRDISALKRFQAELNAHIHDLTILRQIDSELSDNLSLSYVTRLALDATMRLSSASSGFITVKENESLSVRYWLGGYDSDNLDAYVASCKGAIGRVVENQQAEMILDMQSVPPDERLLDDTIAQMIIPLISQDRFVGLLMLETKYPDRFDHGTFEFVKLITGRVAVMLDNANLHDQTEQQVEELQRLYDEVSKLEQLKTDMIRIASHDLKNPLAAILGYVEMLGWDAQHFDDSQREYLGNVEKAARQMQKITTGILSLERIEQMAQSANARLFNLGETLRWAANEHMPTARQKKQTLTVHVPKRRIMVMGDKLQLHEAISNLIGNALKYTPNTGTIRASLSLKGDRVTLLVHDNGYGIPKDQQKRLFNPFFRAKTEETKEIEGTGLGLHLVKNIVERHDGAMIFESVYGEGSTFGFWLPSIERSMINGPDVVDDDDDDETPGEINGSTVVG